MTIPRYAFFDVDGTLISVKSTLSFQDYWLRTECDRTTAQEFYDQFADLRAQGAPREVLNRIFYGHFKGRPVDKVRQRAQEWFAANDNRSFWLYSVIGHLEELRRHGYEPVFISGSFQAALAPIAERLGVEHVLAADLEEESGLYTGVLRAPQTIGDGKAVAMNAFMKRMKVNPRYCHACGDDLSDLPMLEAVESKAVVAGDPRLEAIARQRGWPILYP